jgi:lipoprotein-anchoring transpeptidase ErfK/SrfK
MRYKRAVIMRNIIKCLGVVFFTFAPPQFVSAQQYYHDYPYSYGTPQGQHGAAARSYPGRHPMANLQYDNRDAEMILRDQMYRHNEQHAQPDPGAQQGYDNYYGHRINDESREQQVMSGARYIGSLIRNRNGKPFLVIDKRNFQFYLYDRDGRLLRIGPVAIGKGKTNVGAFETPVGLFPIKSKVPIDDWIRPDWYFVEEGEPIPKRYEDRRVPGFFRYKLVFDGARYIHYAEATGGRLTHGCIGLDWQDAEAVYHTMQVGSHCVIIDDAIVARLARGENLAPKTAAAKKPDETPTGTDRPPVERKSAPSVQNSAGNGERIFRSMW